MSKQEESREHILAELRERAKELNCLYSVDEILSDPDQDIENVIRAIAGALPAGWQYPDICCARVALLGRVCQTDDFVETEWKQSAEVLVKDESIGKVEVFYIDEKPKIDEGPFLKEERRLIDALAERIGLFVIQRRLRSAHKSWEEVVEQISDKSHNDWIVILDFLRRTDQKLLIRGTRKMINHLCWMGVDDAQDLLQEFLSEGEERLPIDDNKPTHRSRLRNLSELTDKTFRIASRHYSDGEILSFLQKWIEEDKTSVLIDTLENADSDLAEISDAVSKFETTGVKESELSVAVQKTLRVSLLRRLFTDDMAFINVAKNFVEVQDFFNILRHVIYPSKSHGKLGGKTAGMFLASQVVKKSTEHSELFANLKTPKSWFLSSDCLRLFMHFNNLEDVYDRKYIEIERIRQGYQHIVQVFKNSLFPPEIVKGLASALDDFDDSPLIVRSSSLLEDRTGSSFSGKYKSLFLANQGTKTQRLDAIQDAIAEVYASVFGPDPIEYRAEKGLLDVHEEMGILIQEVVGTKVGKYFMPAFAGVAYNNNEFRWSARIKREDGLVRMVPGLGTRAVDRLSDDYPVLLAPGQPGLRVNVTSDEVVRYSPNKIDVINLEANAFETVDVGKLIEECGDHYPMAKQIVSIIEDDRVRMPVGLEPEWGKDEFAVTFQGLFADTNFVSQIRTLMNLLLEKFNAPVDIEFAHDGKDFYLLQCRTQSSSEKYGPVRIPRNLSEDKVIFSANRFISNGYVPDITHIVYVDPDGYGEIGDIGTLKQVGRAVGKLNTMLPKRQFILMGPGRWGSRGDIKLGVDVTYSDISNTAVLIEIARKKGNYLPELSFGTHFFQDLVEADIRFIPLYPDEPGVAFNELFLTRSKNILADIAPEFNHLAETVRVIDVPRQTGGQVLRILMNAELDEAVGILDKPMEGGRPTLLESFKIDATPGDHWRWRCRMAEKIAARLDSKRYGVKAFYVFGSAKNATAGPGSDLDIIVHFGGNDRQKMDLSLWLDGWSRSLAEVNFLRTGYEMEGLLDVHFVTDKDIENKTSFASKIGAITDSARPLVLGGRSQDDPCR